MPALFWSLIRTFKMNFQEFLTEIKGSTLPQLLEKASQRYEDLPCLRRFENEKIAGYSFREVYQMAFRIGGDYENPSATGVKGFSQTAIPAKRPTL